MDENAEMKRFADRLWEYFRPKIEELTRSNVWYFRAQVTKEAANGKITIQRPFDEEVALPYVSSMENAAVGSQVTVFVFGSSMTNAVICGNGSLSILGGTNSGGSGSGSAENAVLYTAQILNSSQQEQARRNIGAGTSSFSGLYADLQGKPEIPSAYLLPVATPTQLGGVKPVAKTSAMTQNVGVDGNGALFTEPGKGGDVESVDGETGAVTTNAVKYTAQNLSTVQQRRARDNIGAVSSSDLAGKQTQISVSGILKGNGAGNITAAASGTDYVAPDQLDNKQDKVDVTGILQGSGGGVITTATLQEATLIDMSGMSVGDLMKVKSVDEDGNPIEWEAAIPGVDYMPAVPVTAADNGKSLKVVNGAWAASN